MNSRNQIQCGLVHLGCSSPADDIRILEIDDETIAFFLCSLAYFLSL